MIDDQTLMAYADGELDFEKRKRVENAAAADPITAKRLMDHVALRNKMTEAFAGVLTEPVPPRLITAASGGVPSGGAVIDLAAARAARAPKLKQPWPIGGAIAASLIAGLLLGAGLEALRPAPLISGRGGEMIAQGDLSKALTTQLAADQTGAQTVKIGLSFRTASGDYCRTFRVDRQTSMAGIACRGPQAWSVKLATSTEPVQTSDSYRTASSAMPPAVMQYIENLAVGQALNAGEEAKAKAQGWIQK